MRCKMEHLRSHSISQSSNHHLASLSTQHVYNNEPEFTAAAHVVEEGLLMQDSRTVARLLTELRERDAQIRSLKDELAKASSKELKVGELPKCAGSSIILDHVKERTKSKQTQKRGQSQGCIRDVNVEI